MAANPISPEPLLRGMFVVIMHVLGKFDVFTLLFDPPCLSLVYRFGNEMKSVLDAHGERLTAVEAAAHVSIDDDL